ncbi:MAG: hypothetical protein SGILL_001274 [Bacillariaceae sp.]
MGFRQHSQAATTIDHRHGKFSTFQLQSIADDVGSPPQPIVALNVILRIKPEVRDEFLKVILNNQQGTMNKELEPLALEYTFGEDASEPNTFHFHEKYIGEEGIAAHNSAPHFLVWEEFAGTDPFTAPPEVYKFVIYQE